ncbi:MAG: class I SAM-dependent methyltransferase, partial [Candidatus Saelkia tenebricola]|nr:class I SAM-dependent methyltransferase [Candidatus Saelkia tenebricola]
MASFGRYSSFIQEAVKFMNIEPGDRILDLGAGTGRNACLMMEYLSSEGKLIGIDVSHEMIGQFRKKCVSFPNARIINARVDKGFPFKENFDKVFISFLLHGFPQQVRESIIENVCRILKKNGFFFILDYNEFFYSEMPFYFKVFFKMIECPYAFDFIERNWKSILYSKNFGFFEEKLFFKNYVRMLKAKKDS